MAINDATGMRMTRDNAQRLSDDLLALTGMEVLVGFPEDTTGRENEDNSGITNAALGYIHNNGAPEQNIPARPFMEPGIMESKTDFAETLEGIAKKFLKTHDMAAAERGFHVLGLKAQFGLRRKINEGVPPPLADATLKERARRGRKGAKQELANRAKGEAPSTQLAKPLIDTGQLRNAINYVIRPRKARG